MSKTNNKLLIITYYWPPAGGPGVQRWLKFVKYLPEFGIEPIVYIPENPTYPIVDEKLVQEVSDTLTLIRKPIKEPYALAGFFSKKNTQKISSGIIPAAKKQSVIERFLLWVRGNMFIPDARVLWVKPSVSFLEHYIIENDIHTVVTSGPPHSLHLIGKALKQKTGVKWLADFRDPWTTIGYHKALKLSQSAAAKHKKLEREVLTEADVVIVTSKTTKVEFEAITAKPIHVITNGYDTEKVTPIPMDAKFSLAHIGSFLSDRNPKVLWEVIAELIKENEAFAQHFELKLIGKVSQEILDSLARYGLTNYVNNLGYMSHDKAVAHQRSAQVLLLVEIDSPETRCIIPGKVFEYIVSGRPIVALGPEGSDFAEIITGTNTGKFITYSDKAHLKQTLLHYFESYESGHLTVHPVGLQQYSRRNLTEQLVNIL